MNNDVLAVAVNRRSLIAGIALCGALAPSVMLAEGGLKGGNTDDSDQAPDDALTELGLTGKRSYESPQFGYELAWGRDWEIYAASPGESSTADELDTLTLEWADAGTGEIAYINFLGFTIPAPNVGLMMDNAENPRTVAEMYGGGFDVEVVLAERDDDIQEVAYHLTAVDDRDTQRWMISSLRVLDEGLVLTTNLLLADEDLLAEVSEAFVDGVSLNDAPLMQILSADAMLDAYAAGR